MSSERILVYLLSSSEDLLLEQALANFRERFAEEGDLDFNMSTFDGDSADVDEIVEVCNTMPFLVERRLVVVRNADRLSREAQDRLATYSSDPSPFAALVLVGQKFPKNQKLFKAVDALGKRGYVKDFAAPRKSEYPARVRDLFAARGRRIDMDAAELMVRGVGYDLRRLAVEVDKAVSFSGEHTELTRADIEAVLSTTAPTSMFDFLDALAAREGLTAMRLLSDLLGEGESIFGLNAMAVRQVRELVAAQSLAARGDGSPGALAAVLGKQEWQVRRVPMYAKRFAPGELAGLMRMAAATEAEMKTSRDPRLAFERFVLSVCGA